MDNNSLVIPCLKCGAKNRIPVSRIQEKPKCGKCGAPISTNVSDKPVDVTDATFEKEVLHSRLPVLVDCWAPWCGPCKAVGPVLDELAGKYKYRLKIAKVNVDENQGIGSKYAVSSIPTMFLVKNGKIIDQLVGALPKEEIEKQIARII